MRRFRHSAIVPVMPFATLVLLAGAPPAAATEPAPALSAAKADSLAWLAGAWSGTHGGLEMEETWTAPKGGTLLGVHRDVKGGKTVSFEFLRIAESTNGLVYHASPGGKPSTPFTLVESGPTRAVFQNLEHDYPKRILYWTDDKGALHARVEGAPGGKAPAMEWTWKK